MNMEIKDRIKELRESTGMNRKEFCEYFGIPYRTVTEWERGTRKMPDYVFRLLAYKIKMENFAGKEEANEEFQYQNKNWMIIFVLRILQKLRQENHVAQML